MTTGKRTIIWKLISTLLITTALSGDVSAQAPAASVERGSQTAKAGFKNEDDIRDKFNNWHEDTDAQAWLAAMGYRLDDIESVRASKPHGEKADVMVRIKLSKPRISGLPQRRQDAKEEPEDKEAGFPLRGRDAENKTNEAVETVEGISKKLVSSPNGFNQIDKRWLANYAKKWNMPGDVVSGLKLYLGEVPPNRPSRDKRRMFLNELEPAEQKSVIDFFTANKEMIVSDLIEGDGADAAGWIMVAFKATDKPRWIIKSSREAVRHFSEGAIEMTRAGNLKIGRITMQRKGGDGGRETANMLQFKINPVHLFNAK